MACEKGRQEMVSGYTRYVMQEPNYLPHRGDGAAM